MNFYFNWDPKEFCRLVGIVTSGSKASVVPVRISKEDIGFVRDEMLALINDIDEGRRYLGVFKGSTKKDLALDATALPTSFDPEKTHTYSAPSMTSFVEIIGEISRNGVELSFSIPRPGSHVYAVLDGKKLQKILGIEEGLRVGVHKFSLMEIPLDPRALSYHIAILGATGTGKSRLAKGIVEEVITKCDNYSVVVFDHTGTDYADKTRWGVDAVIIDASKVVLEPDIIAQVIVEELGLTTYYEEYVYGAVIEYLRRELLKFLQQNDRKVQSFSKHQEVDIDVILTMYKDFARKNLFEWSFNEFIQVLNEYAKLMGARDPTLRKLNLLLMTRLGKKFFENYLNNRSIVLEDVVEEVMRSKKLVIVDLSSEVEYIAKRGLVYQFFKNIWDRILTARGSSRKILAVVDEAHNYCCIHGCEPAKPIIARTAREGRKWGFGVVLATQRVIDLAPEIRGNINTVFFSRLQSSGDYTELKNWLENVQYLEYTLPMLASREFFFAGLGNPLRKPLLVRVKDVK